MNSYDIDELSLVIKNRSTMIWKLLDNWGVQNYREFPWRNTEDPYFILVAEFMLRRTKAKQVVSVYEEFTKKFPTLKLCENASIDDFKPFFTKLGLLYRSEQFYSIVQEISTKKNFNWTIKELKKLEGIGDYTATAIQVFSFNKNYLVIDTNTGRWISRLVNLNINKEFHKNKLIKGLSGVISPNNSPKAKNYYLLDFCASICKPKKPLCLKCTISDLCDYEIM